MSRFDKDWFDPRATYDGIDWSHMPPEGEWEQGPIADWTRVFDEAKYETTFARVVLLPNRAFDGVYEQPSSVDLLSMISRVRAWLSQW